MDKIADLAKQILEKLVDFFDIFDLSFFVSGAMVLAGMLLVINTTPNFPQPEWSSGMSLAAAVIACYILGLVAFAAGRGLRQRVLRWMNNTETTASWFWPAAGHHEILKHPPFQAYNTHADLIRGEDAELAGAVYTRLWVELRQREDLKPSFQLIRRYWVLSATYDGVAVALASWALVAALLIFNGLFETMFSGLPMPEWAPLWVPPVVLVVFFFVIFAFLVYSCFREAQRYQRYQVVEIVATMAYMQSDPELVAKPRLVSAVASAKTSDDKVKTKEGGKKKEGDGGGVTAKPKGGSDKEGGGSGGDASVSAKAAAGGESISDLASTGRPRG